MYMFTSGFSSFFKKAKRIRTLHHQKHDFKENGGCFLFKSQSVVADCVSAHFFLWRDELISKLTPGCHTEDNAATHKIEYIIFLKCQRSFQDLSQRSFIYSTRREKKKKTIALQYHETTVISFGQSVAVIPKNVQVLKNKIQLKLQPNTALVSVLCCAVA